MNRYPSKAVLLPIGSVFRTLLALIVVLSTFAAVPQHSLAATGQKSGTLQIAVGDLVSLQSSNFPDRYIRHTSYRGRIDPIATETEQQDSTFRVVSGLADATAISLEAFNFPNFFLTVEENTIMLRERPAADAQFDANATFIRQPGLSDPTLLSLESYVQPGGYVRHSSYVLYVNPSDGSDLFKADATFRPTAPNWTPAVEPTAEPATPPTPTAAPVEPTVAPTAVPTVAPTPEPTPEPTTICTQEDFLAAVKEGETSGTITFDGDCRYLLTKAGDDWNGGSGAFLWKTTVIEGNGAVIERDAAAPAFRLLALQVPAGTTIRNLTIRNGANAQNGGGLFANSPLTLENVTLEDNTSKARGGALSAAKDLTVTASRLRNNSATDLGGAIYSQGNLLLQDVTITDGSGTQGGAIAQLSGNLTIDNGRLLNNHASDIGGAIYKQAGELAITNSLFAQNRADSTNGAAVFIGGGVTGNAAMTNNTITDNAGNLGAAITVWGALTLRNTIIANHETALASGKPISEDYNLFANNRTNVQEFNGITIERGGHSIQAPDAQFVDASALDYTIKASSPAVDKGTDAVLGAGSNLTTDAASLARPYSGTLVDIGAYELQGEGIASLSIVKQGPYWLVAGSAADFSLTVANNGVRSGEALEVVDLLPAGAEYVADSASQHGTFADGQLTWQLDALAPGERTIITYTVKASQTLVSKDYSVQSATDPAVMAQGAVITTPLNAKIVAALNFFPRPDGFSFPNYGDSPDSDLTADDLVTIFGAETACKVTTADGCVLTATAEAWRKKWLNFVAGGHCAGMAMGSLNIFANAAVTPGDYQSSANLTFDLTKENARKYVALYATTQSLRPQNWSELQEANGYDWNPNAKYVAIGGGQSAWRTDPGELLDTLIANLKDPNATDRFRLSFSYYGGGGGHTVVPFAVEQLNENDYLIYIYENNRPNHFDLAVRINRATGAWSYVGTTRPDQPLNKYYGNATSNNLSLTSWQYAHTFPKCMEGSACPATTAAPAGSVQSADTTQAADGALLEGETVEIQLDGEGYHLVTRSDGKRVGYDLTTGEWISEIEGAQAVEIPLGLGLNIPAAIRIPHEAGMTYTIQVASRDTAYGNTEAPANVNIFAPAMVMSLENLVLDTPGSPAAPDLMSLSIDPAANRITFEPGVDDGESPSLSLAISQPDGFDFSIDVKDVPVEKGHAVALSFDQESQSATIEGNGDGETLYQVAVKRISTDGTTASFESDSVSDGGNAGATLKIGEEWNGEADPEIQIEENSTLPAPIVIDEEETTGNSYAAEVQWGGEDAAWNDGGSWVIGSRPDQRVVALNITSEDGGQTLVGTVSYAGEGPIAFRATSTAQNTYAVETQSGGDDASWHPEGTWVLGGREEQNVVAIDISSGDEGNTLGGTITYAGEGPIAFRTALQPAPSEESTAPGSAATAQDAAQATLCDPANIPDPTDTDVMVRFVNNSAAAGHLYWIDFDNQRQAYGTIEAGAAHDQATFADHRWEVYDANPEEVDDLSTHLLLSYSATDELKQCVMIEQP